MTLEKVLKKIGGDSWSRELCYIIITTGGEEGMLFSSIVKQVEKYWYSPRDVSPTTATVAGLQALIHSGRIYEESTNFKLEGGGADRLYSTQKSG